MSTVVSMAPSPAPHERANYNNLEVTSTSHNSSPPATRASTATQLTARRESDSPKAGAEGKKSSPNGCVEILPKNPFPSANKHYAGLAIALQRS